MDHNAKILTDRHSKLQATEQYNLNLSNQLRSNTVKFNRRRRHHRRRQTQRDRGWMIVDKQRGENGKERM